MANVLSKALNEAVIRRLADAQTWQRGQDYFAHGHVESIEETADGARAAVRGDRDYTVTLTSGDGVLDYSCDCSAGGEGTFCMHCAAAALAWLKREAGPEKAAPPRKPREIALPQAARILEEEDKGTLVKMILEWARDDALLRERLVLHAARKTGPDAGRVAVQKAFQKAIRVSGYADYREAAGWARGVHKAIDAIEQLRADGQAAAVAGLCESALQSLADAIESVDDSDGHFTTLRDRLEDIHYHACLEAPPDPVELAKRLFHQELHSDFDIFSGAAERYAKILKASGLKAYRQLAEAEWAKVPVRTGVNERTESGRHFRITCIMESLARASGDTEELVAVMSRDLSSPYHYLKIAEVWRGAGQFDNALLWAEKGLKAFPNRNDSRLREFAADEYHRLLRHDAAMNLMWAEFTERPSAGTYQTLEKHAEKASAWPAWRERALAEIRARIATAKRQPRGAAHWWSSGADHSLLVEIFLNEGRVEDAWREAGAGGCSDRLWLQLAEEREQEHPADAAPIYLKYAEAFTGRVSKGNYDEPVNLLIRAAAVMRRLDRGAEFVRHLESLRAKYKIKRNFIKLVEKNRKSLYLT